MENCQGCLASYVLGNRVLSLDSFAYELEATEVIWQQAQEVEVNYGIELLVQPWSLMVSRFADDEYKTVYSLQSSASGEYHSQ